mmetsp:Transcript_35992/g.67126  ORF Transcript_35992/g.67126 Transcript_35992/m.67126 type:complete len:382 (+) Transcript_35992:92-1237(+)
MTSLFFYLTVFCVITTSFGVVLRHVTNATIAGTEPWLDHDQRAAASHDAESLAKKCMYTTDITANRENIVHMCLAHDAQKYGSGSSIISILTQHGFLPTCRVMQLMLWMYATVEGGHLPHNFFVDVGSNIGSCSVNMAAIGVKSVAVEPFQAHVDIIQSSKDINKHMSIHLVHGGVGENATTVMTKFVHGRGNYGSTMFVPQKNIAPALRRRRLGLPAEDTNQTLDIVTLEDILSVSEGVVPLVKLDCEGCEWEALLSAKSQLDKVQMIKMEVNRPYVWSKYKHFSTTQQLQYIQDQGFYLFAEIYPDSQYYFRSNPVSDIDLMFGGKKVPDTTFSYDLLAKYAKQILQQKISPKQHNVKSSPDIIAIRKELYDKMAAYFF